MGLFSAFVVGPGIYFYPVFFVYVFIHSICSMFYSCPHVRFVLSLFGISVMLLAFLFKSALFFFFVPSYHGHVFLPYRPALLRPGEALN